MVVEIGGRPETLGYSPHTCIALNIETLYHKKSKFTVLEVIKIT